MSASLTIFFMTNNVIRIRGARVHNLKNIDLDLPRDKFVVITGLSGSGKSSLAFDTIYAEGQRRYVESLSAYARQFLGLMDKPDVDHIDGLSPAISIDQKTTSANPRSTVGTITEIHDYLRLLFSRVGQPYCPKCDKPIKSQTINEIISRVNKNFNDKKIYLMAPVVVDQKGEHRGLIMELKKAGYVRLMLNGQLYPIDEAAAVPLDKQKKHSISVVVDRFLVSSDEKKRLNDSLETALDLGNGLVTVMEADKIESQIMFNQRLACPSCGFSLPKIEPRNFSFNSPHGACQKCSGLGTMLEVDVDLVIPNKRLTLNEGAIRPWSRSAANQGWYMRMLERVAKEYKFSLDVPVEKLDKKHLNVVLYGTSDQKYQMNISGGSFNGEYNGTYEGVIPNLERRYKETDSDFIRGEIEKYMRVNLCPECNGKRLRSEYLAVKIDDKNIDDLSRMNVEQLHSFFKKINSKDKDAIKFTANENKIADPIIKEIRNRLSFLDNVGLSYLTLGRSSATLSGGEAQRIRLATQIGSSLVGVLYILDEPSIGLHQRDNDRLIETLKKLRDLGNTVIVVEHDEATILEADYVVDIGPGAGAHGGNVIAAGTPAQIKKSKQSLTGKYLSGEKKIMMPKSYRKGNGKFLEIIGASAFNLKNIDVKIPLGKFVCITGVSGSGKSTLMTDILSKSLLRHFYHSKDVPEAHKEIKGVENIDKIIDIDQSAIGRTPRSNPATYTGLFTPIRDLFAQLPEAKMRGYQPGRFSFNVKGGRCEACQGDGLVRIEMNFLPDVYVECSECHGQRYNQSTLEVHYKGKNISEVLNMTVEEANSFFANVPAIRQKLSTLKEVGLGYIKLGQSATTLSGGEAQRIKLATELARKSTGKTLYVLDEPTTGLHFEDINRLLLVLHQLVDKGNSVLIIEHQLDVIKAADWIIDMGPGGGDEGGTVVAQGTPKDVAKVTESFTGQYLKKILK